MACRQGAKKIIFTACHLGKLKLAFTSPDFISTSPKNVLTSRIDFTVLLLFEFFKTHHLPVGQVKNRTHQASLIAKSISPGLSGTTFVARCAENTIQSCAFGPSITRNLITSVLSICLVKLTQSTVMEQKCFDLRSFITPTL